MRLKLNAWTKAVNASLAKLGREPLSDLETDDTPDAELCRQFLPEAVGAVAEYSDWTFLRCREVLYGYDGAFDIPDGCARLSKVDTMGFPFEIIGNEIQTEAPVVTISYQEYPPTPASLPMYFRSAIEAYLTYMLAKPLSGNDAIRQESFQLFTSLAEKAKNNDRAYLGGNGTKWWTEEIG